MRAYQVDSVSGARLVGGELLDWSDLERGTSFGAAGPLFTYLQPARRTPRRVLLAGPRAARALDLAAPDGEVDVLVRGLDDARALSSTAQLRQGATVYCGSLERFEPPVPYDLVVVLDGPAGVTSPDCEGIGHRPMLQRLAKWLAPEGTLVALLENDLGFDRLFRLRTSRSDDDASWDHGAPGFDPRPLYRRELAEALGQAGLQADTVYGVFPAAEDLGLLIGAECLQEPELARGAAALAARLVVDHFSREPALVDAYDLALRLFDSGEAMALASAWLVVSRPTGAALGADPAPSVAPALIAVETSGRPEWRAVRTVEREGGTWSQRLRPLVRAEERREGRVLRRFDGSGGRPRELPAGTTLEAALRRASGRLDTGAVRRLIGQYRGWLQQQPTDVSGEDPRFFAVPSNILVDGDRLQVLDDSWRLTQVLDGDVLLVRGLRDFARRLLRAGAEHPWAPDTSPDRLTRTLAAMAGVEVSAQAIDAVAQLEAELEVVLSGGDEAAESLAYAHNLDSGRSQFVAQSGPLRGYREAAAANGRLAQELSARQSQVQWLELTLRLRDRRLGDLERQLTATRGSASFRIGRVLTWPLRALVQLTRRVVMSAIPPGYANRVLELARRLGMRAGS